MAARSLYRLFLIGGLIALAGILGGFIGVYLLLKAIDAFGSWLYLGLGVAFAVIAVVWYIYDSLKEKKSRAPTHFETPKKSDDSETETHEEDNSSD
jgi:4-hydroxybenzoate polyprenyltransferase